MIVAIVDALGIIVAVIFFVRRRNRSDPTTSAPRRVVMTQVALNDNDGLITLQFPPPGMQNDPTPSVSTAPPGSFFSMDVECDA